MVAWPKIRGLGDMGRGWGGREDDYLSFAASHPCTVVILGGELYNTIRFFGIVWLQNISAIYRFPHT